MNILITGANGYLASNIIKKLENTKYNLFKVTRNSLNLLSQKDIQSFVYKHSIDHIIHCAIEGGMRTVSDTDQIVVNNITMAHNLMSCKINGMFFNIASGAEFDRTRDIYNFKENELYSSFPQDYYGLSKNIIAKLTNVMSNGINLRLFNCFNYNEESSRMIRSNIINYINKNPIIIHQNKYVDFLYMEDFCTLLLYLLNTPVKTKDVNIVYQKKYSLLSIADMINNLDTHKVSVIVENKNLGTNYCGDGSTLANFNLNFIGIENGLRECYNKLL